MTVTSPQSLTDPQAAILVRLCQSAVLSHEEREAVLAGAKALEREARAREYDRRGE